MLQWTTKVVSTLLKCDPVDLDDILEAYDDGDVVFTEPHPKLLARYLALLCDLETTTVACHIESM